MKRYRGTGNRLRRTTGSVIAEFGPALWLLLIGIFFPMLDLTAMLASYGSCLLLNGIQVHEASLIHWSSATAPGGPVRKAIPDGWKTSGLGQFVKVVGSPATAVSYRPGEKDANGIIDQIVAVKTTVNCRPFLTVPLFGLSVPGLNAPMAFVIGSERPMENPDFAKH